MTGYFFFNLLPPDSGVMCDHISSVAGRLLFLPVTTDFGETSCMESGFFSPSKNHEDFFFDRFTDWLFLHCVIKSHFFLQSSVGMLKYFLV